MIRPNLLALLTLLATGPLSLACSPSLCAPVKKIIKADVVVAAVAAVAYVPTYGATYNASQADEVNGEILRQLLEVMRRIEAKLDQQAQRPPVTVPSQAVDAGKLMAARCAGCHQANVAKSKGGELVLIEDTGKLPAFSVPEQRLVKRVIDTGAMPPKTAGPPLTAGERAALLEFMFPKPKE